MMSPEPAEGQRGRRRELGTSHWEVRCGGLQGAAGVGARGAWPDGGRERGGRSGEIGSRSVRAW